MQDYATDVTREMATKFKNAAGSLLQVTHDAVFEEGNAQYRILYAKPSHRLASTLCVDREILILISRFEDQQVRTISAAQSAINQSQNRLEPTVVIIVHRDPRGNHKLKNWGRERGLAVLPVLIGRERIPEGDKFESLLATELFSHDPFDVTGPVDDDANFFGRRTEAQDLARKLQTGQIRACFGIRKIGKTSILNRVIRECQDYYDCICVIVDCSRDEIWSMSATNFLKSICEAINRALQQEQRYAKVEPIKDHSSLPDIAKGLAETIETSTRPIILFLDEVDYIGPGSPTANQWRVEFNPMWRTLRAIYQECTRGKKNLSLFISGVSSKWFSVEDIEGVENAALALVPEEYLLPLPRGASIAMIKTMSRRAGLQFADSECELVALTCSDIPFWIRKACSFIHRQISVDVRPTSISVSDLKGYLEEFLQSEGGSLAGVALRHLFRVYPELEEACLRCTVVNGEAVSPHVYKTLEKYGIVQPRSKQYILSGPLVKVGWEWFLSNKTRKSEGEHAQSEQEESDTSLYGNWADELAMISKRRNIIERQLRELILNFIRMDSLNNSQKGTVQQRLLNSISKERRGKLETKNPHDLMQSLYWLELRQVVGREWEIFGKLFNDKNAFELNSMIINERPDAHAKEIDAADLALHKRSLAWMEERILNA